MMLFAISISIKLKKSNIKEKRLSFSKNKSMGWEEALIFRKETLDLVSGIILHSFCISQQSVLMLALFILN